MTNIYKIEFLKSRQSKCRHKKLVDSRNVDRYQMHNFVDICLPLSTFLRKPISTSTRSRTLPFETNVHQVTRNASALQGGAHSSASNTIKNWISHCLAFVALVAFGHSGPRASSSASLARRSASGTIYKKSSLNGLNRCVFIKKKYLMSY